MADLGGPDRRRLQLGLTLPVEPPLSVWDLPTREELAALPVARERVPGSGDQGPDDLVARGADLAPGTLLAAYRNGLFPMPFDDRGGPAWWCPARRGVLQPADLRVTRSLRKSAAHLYTTVDESFPEVLAACAHSPRPGAWISADVVAAYTRLHTLGWAHSVETRAADGRLVGGLYGVAIGGLFAGESMYHEGSPQGRDASKVALRALCAALSADGVERLVDVQWLTPHLSALGAVRVDRSDYLARLPALLDLPPPPAWA